jgi:K+-transporting ATPase ATPase A chain
MWGLTLNQTEELISQYTQPRFLYIFGEPTVNVLELNLALSQLQNGTVASSLSGNVNFPLGATDNTYILGLQDMDWVELIIFFALIFLLIFPLGKFIFRIYSQDKPNKFENALFRVSNTAPTDEMNWKTYAISMMLFNGIGIAFLFVLCLLQGYLPLNPNGYSSLSPDLAFNVAISFATNTNWQSYAGEAQLSYLTQMLGLTTQNFMSAATGIAVLMALIRGLTRKSTSKLGNFWADMFRGTEILLLLSSIMTVFLISQGCPQTLGGPFTVPMLQPLYNSSGNLISQTIQVGPVASQTAIQILGSNGGGFFNANCAQPFANPSPFSCLVELLGIIVVPASLCVTFGYMVKDQREGMAIFAAMLILYITFCILVIWAEMQGNPLFQFLNVNQAWGNMEGKETRFGTVLSALFNTSTTATSNGSVIAAMESFTPLGLLGPLLLMQMGEIVFGGVGCGLYGMLTFVLAANFIAGLMIGRTPEYLGKKLGSREIKFVTILILLPIVAILVGCSVALLDPNAVQSIFNSGPRGFTEILYAFTSCIANNGSALAGLNANTPFFNIILGIEMFVGRYPVAWITLALAGSLAESKITPPSAGTLKTYTPLYIGWLIGVIVIVGVLSFIPVLILGPIVEAML